MFVSIIHFLANHAMAEKMRTISQIIVVKVNQNDIANNIHALARFIAIILLNSCLLPGFSTPAYRQLYCDLTLMVRPPSWTFCWETTFTTTSLSRLINWSPSQRFQTMPPIMSGHASSIIWVGLLYLLYLKMLGMYLYILIIGHKSCNMLCILK